MEELKILCMKLELPMVEIIEVGESFSFSVDDLKRIKSTTRSQSET